MKQGLKITYIRYLAAKKYVDDRALNGHVWQTLKTNLPSSCSQEKLEVIEFGAGTGTMFERAISWGLSPHLHYTMVEINPEYLAAFTSPPFQNRHSSSHTLEWRSSTSADIRSTDVDGTVDIVCADLNDVISNQKYHRRWDLIMAHAVMDLVKIDDVLTGFEQLVKPGGLLYLSLNYDGLTSFLPPFDSAFEHHLFERYHHSMDQRTTNGRPAGSSRSGRELFSQLSKRHLSILAAGSSDWIVYPTVRGYLDNDAYFLQTILQTIHQELQRDNQLDPHRLDAWVARRQAQINATELIFMARNIDFLVKVPAD